MTPMSHTKGMFLSYTDGADEDEVPHDCTDPTCPGAVNKRKLEAFEGLYKEVLALFDAVDFLDESMVEARIFELRVIVARLAKAEGRT